jgi:hypothetical protein
LTKAAGMQHKEVAKKRVFDEFSTDRTEQQHKRLQASKGSETKAGMHPTRQPWQLPDINSVQRPTLFSSGRVCSWAVVPWSRAYARLGGGRT